MGARSRISPASRGPRPEAAADRRRQGYLRAGRLRFLTLAEGGTEIQVMVGPLRGPEQRDLVRRRGYYHVPADAIAAARTGAQVIAFYEPAGAFGRRTGQIREYAPVRKLSRVPRRELPALTWPGRRGESAEYYRFDLGPLCSLPEPITNPEGLRVVFRFLDLDRLRAARTVRDLARRTAPTG